MGKRLAAAETRADLIDGAKVGVVLKREVLSPDRGILDLVGQLDHPEEGILRFLFSLEDIDEEECRRDRREPARDGRDESDPGRTGWFGGHLDLFLKKRFIGRRHP